MNRSDSVVITGVGLATSLGITAEQTWRAILDGRNGLGSMPALEVPTPPEKGGYQAMDLPPHFAAGSAREVRYLRWTLHAALQHAGLLEKLPYPAARCGIVLGTTLHGMRGGGEFLRSGDFARLRGFTAGSVLASAIEGLELGGDAVTTCSACSSGLASVALGVTLLHSGTLDLVIVGGYDAASEYAYAGFNSLRLVTEGPLRPFARGRTGMKLGEGYAALILDRAADAASRDAAPVAQILGWGESADAHHLTQPHPQGVGAAAAMRTALDRAGLSPQQIDLISAHATGTPDNDAGEHAAMASVFGDALPHVPVVAFKSRLGHTLGAAGAVELALSAMALRDGVVPATAGTTPQDLEFADLNLSLGEPRRQPMCTAMSLSLGFGGANAAVVIGLPQQQPRQFKPRPAGRDVLITGIGVVLPGAIGVDAMARMQSPAWETEPQRIADGEIEPLLNARRVRRMSDYVKLSLAATALACRDAAIGDEGLDPNCAVMLGMTHGSATYCIDYYRQLVQGGLVAANPMLFAEGVPNAASAHLSLMLGLKGGCQTIIGSRNAGLDALRLASLRIASGEWEQAIVGAAEEFVPLVNDAYRAMGLHAGAEAGPPMSSRTGFRAGSGAVTLLLESRPAMERRGGRARGKILGSGAVRFDLPRSARAIGAMLKQVGAGGMVHCSANATWIDRLERAAVSIAGNASVDTPYGQVPELFSVMPLWALARQLTTAGATQAFTVLCTSFFGTSTAVSIAPVG